MSLIAHRYDGAQTLGGVTDQRADNQFLLRSRLIWSLSPALSIQGNLKYTLNDSNFALFEYDGFSGDIRVRYELN